MADLLAQAAHRAGIPLWLMRAMVGQESGGNPNAVSPVGARGRTQLMPATARRLEQTYGINTSTEFGNLLGGAYYLKEQLDRFKSIPLALAAYNAGPGAVQKYGGIPPFKETQDYVRSIMGKRGAGGGASPAGFAGDPVAGAADPMGQGAPSAPFSMQDAARQGLGALASGNYDPMQGLKALQRAARETATAMQSTQRMNIGSMALPVFASGGNATARERKAAAMVQQYQGVPYVWGGSTPKGFDCSGLLQWVWGHLGVKIPRTTYDQWGAGRAVGKGGLRPGDAVFFRGSDARGNLPGHVGMYIGGGLFVEAPHTGSSVHISKLRGRADYVGARRYG